MNEGVFMSYIIRRKVRKAIYVYECTSYRNKDGKPRSKQKYLGKLDSDGVLISSKRKLPVQITEVKTVKKRFILTEITSRNVHTSRKARTSDTPASVNDTLPAREQSYSRVRPNIYLQAQPAQTRRRFHLASYLTLPLFCHPCPHLQFKS